MVCVTSATAWFNSSIRHDKNKRFRFAPMQSPSGKRILAQIGETEPDNTSVYVRKNRILTRSSAALYIARDLGGRGRSPTPSYWYRASYVMPCTTLVARNRFKWFGRREQCMAARSQGGGRPVPSACKFRGKMLLARPSLRSWFLPLYSGSPDQAYTCPITDHSNSPLQSPTCSLHVPFRPKVR